MLSEATTKKDSAIAAAALAPVPVVPGPVPLVFRLPVELLLPAGIPVSCERMPPGVIASVGR